MRRATESQPPCARPTRDFYPRSPCGERHIALCFIPLFEIFLSTLSLRRATCIACRHIQAYNNFYPRSPCGERHGFPAGFLPAGDFYPRSPCGERPFVTRYNLILVCDFYPRSPCGERPAIISTLWRMIWIFLSTLSLRRATCVVVQLVQQHLYFYPRSPCGERRGAMLSGYFRALISIHALLAESDCPYCGAKPLQSISIHALLAESDPAWPACHLQSPVFLSTLSLRRATPLLFWRGKPARYFYPRSPCGERRALHVGTYRHIIISIHALLAESDFMQWVEGLACIKFLSTLSLRRATRASSAVPGREVFLSTLSLRRATQMPTGMKRRYVISIHALLAESDSASRRPFSSASAFLSTLSLRRATLWGHVMTARSCDFYPRSPCGERPYASRTRAAATRISIHALLAESDINARRKRQTTHIFLSTLSLRRATMQWVEGLACIKFLSTLSLRRATGMACMPFTEPRISIHALLAESDAGMAALGQVFTISIHALLAESDRGRIGVHVQALEISIHALLAESDLVCEFSGNRTLISIHALLAESDRKSIKSFVSVTNFYPRSPCGERLEVESMLTANQRISIHALLAESDGL